MLKLPPYWNRCATGHIVAELLRQADKIGVYNLVAYFLVRAAIDLMFAQARWKTYKPLPLVTPTANGWRVGDSVFYILPTTKEMQPRGLDALLGVRGEINLLVPPGFESAVLGAIRSVSLRRRVSVQGIDAFVDTRLVWTGIDMQWSRSACTVDFLTRYRDLTSGNADVTIPLPLPK